MKTIIVLTVILVVFLTWYKKNEKKINAIRYAQKVANLNSHKTEKISASNLVVSIEIAKLRDECLKKVMQDKMDYADYNKIFN